MNNFRNINTGEGNDYDIEMNVNYNDSTFSDNNMKDSEKGIENDEEEPENFKVNDKDVKEMPEKCFCLSLFIKEEIYEKHKELCESSCVDGEVVNKKQSDVDIEQIVKWKSRYIEKQLNGFKRLLNEKFSIDNGITRENPWFNQGFGIVFYCEKKILDLTCVFKIGNDIHTCNLTYRDYINDIMKGFKKFKMIEYEQPKKMKEKDMLGSMARFEILKRQDVDVVIFRDAHTTLPNNRYDFDFEWCQTWLGSGKKFWTYQSFHYKPAHVEGKRTSLAATWACKKTDGHLLTPEQFQTYFKFSDDKEKHVNKQMVTDSDSDFYTRRDYGVDERYMYFLSKSDLWNQNIYVVNTAHFWVLLQGQDNPTSRLSNYKINKDVNGGMQYCRPLKMFHTTNPFYVDLKCIIKYSLIESAIYNNLMKCGETEDIPANVYEELTFGHFYTWLYNMWAKPSNRLLENLLRMIPQQKNIWEYLFYNEGNINDTSVFQYLSYNGINIMTGPQCDFYQELWYGHGYFHLDDLHDGIGKIADQLDTTKKICKKSNQDIDFYIYRIGSIPDGSPNKKKFLDELDKIKKEGNVGELERRSQFFNEVIKFYSTPALKRPRARVEHLNAKTKNPNLKKTYS